MNADAQQELLAAERDYMLAAALRDELRVEADRVHARYLSASGEAAVAQTIVDDYARSMYMNGPTNLTVINGLLNAQSPTEFADMQVKVEAVSRVQTQSLLDAVAALEEAQAQDAAAEAAYTEAEAKAFAANTVFMKARSNAARTQAEFADELAVVSENYDQVAQQAAERNATVAQSWADYVASLSKRKTAALPARTTIGETVDDARLLLPEGYRPVPGKKPDTAEPGVAFWGRGGNRLEVLPSETVRAVSSAVNALGAGYLWRAPDDPAVYDCVNLISRSWDGTGIAVPNNLSKIAAGYPKVPLGSVRAGDVVLIANEPDGIHHAGIVVSPGYMVAASAASGQVTVQEIPTEGVWGAVRPSLGPVTELNEIPVPAREEGSEPTMRCDAPPINLNTTGTGAWGGWPNGLIPLSAMCPLADNPGHYFRCDAAKAWEALDRAYRKEFNRPLCLTDSYRTYDVQARIYATGQSQAVPGTSNHGWGLATDLCVYNSAMEKTFISFESPDYVWLRQNAPKYGWIHPMWARQGQPLQESWHWQFGINDSVIPYAP